MNSCFPELKLNDTLIPKIKAESGIKGKPEYLASPYVTAGTRLYMIGYQDGSFPDLGWHLKGEMGGIWDHPIKLMDGFTASVNGVCLSSANKFVNYPVGNSHFYNTDGLEIERFQFVPDDMEICSVCNCVALLLVKLTS